MKINVLYKEFLNLCASNKALVKEKCMSDQKLLLKQKLIDDFLEKLGMYKEAKDIKKSVSKLDELDPETLRDIPLSRIFESVESDY